MIFNIIIVSGMVTMLPRSIYNRLSFTVHRGHYIVHQKQVQTKGIYKKSLLW